MAIKGELGTTSQSLLSQPARDKTSASLTHIADTLNAMTLDSFIMNYSKWNKGHALGQGCTEDELKGAMSAYTQRWIEYKLGWHYPDASEAGFPGLHQKLIKSNYKQK